jgi:hypothetical protein
MVLEINKILTVYPDKGLQFLEWYKGVYGKGITPDQFLRLKDEYKIFIVLIYIEEVKGININCDNFSICISYSLRYKTDKVKELYETQHTTVIYEHTYADREQLDIMYRKAISYTFSYLI